MSEVGELSALLGVVYDAALDATLWPQTIERACGYLNCMSGMIGAYDVLQRNTNLRASWGYEQKYLDTFDYYSSINPVLRRSFAYKIGQVGTISDEMPLAEFRKHRVYLEWAGPQGILDVIQANLERTPTALAVIGISRHDSQGQFDETARRRMATIAPHFRRALLIGKAIDLAHIEAATFSNVIDGLSAAVFLVDADGRLKHANARGTDMLAAADPFSTANGILEAASSTARRKLAASFAAAARGDAAVAELGVAVRVAGSDGRQFVAHVLPMTASRRREADGARGATAALFVRDADLAFPTAVKSMAEIFRLTPSETRVLHVVLEAGGIAMTSLLLRLAESTVKSHLRRIFAKTGTHTQVDLVKLAAGFTSPLAN